METMSFSRNCEGTVAYKFSTGTKQEQSLRGPNANALLFSLDNALRIERRDAGVNCTKGWTFWTGR